ncbi:MAG: VIT domain-containing protein [Acidimicrobiia bacterium]
MTRRVAIAIAMILAIPAPGFAQTGDDVIIEPRPCPWWHCGGEADVSIEEYRVDTVIEDGIATTRVRQVIRNESDFTAEGTFLFPLPADASVTGLTLWIDGEAVSGEVLEGETARRTYEEIIRRTLDPALLEFVDDGILRLSVFPIPAEKTRTVEIEYRQVLAVDGGLTRYRHPFAAETNAEIEVISARIEIRHSSGVKAVHSPTHEVSIDRPDGDTAIIGFEGDGDDLAELIVYYSTDAGPISLDVITHRQDGEGYFLMLVSPGLATDQQVVAKDVVLVLDTSGSMEGEKFSQAQDAARFVLDRLNPEDRFEVIAFSTTTDAYAGSLQPASQAPLARTWIGGLAAGGSTNIDLALGEALDLGEDRPLYVVFLTDGLPTEGVTDSARILDRLEDRGGSSTSVFAFGVGYDVDTFLLDSIARDHHGTTAYVGPGEEIDLAVETLYSKVASPVLTDVTIEVNGVTVSDIHPSPLPDVFSGGQLVVAGRYDEPGDATVVLSGRVRGETVDFTFRDVRFGDSGQDDSIPRLWATRKVGDLLRQVRLEGPDEETIDQIVRLSIRWGIVTPYTSYLVTDDAPFGEEAIGDIAARAAAEAESTPPPVSGETAFGAADAAASMSDSDVVSGPDDTYASLVRVAGGRTFRLTEGKWVDTTYEPGMEAIRVPFGSDDYFALATSDRALGLALTVDASMIVVHQGVAYEVVDAGETGDPLPVLPDEEIIVAPASAPEPSGDDPPIALIVLAGAAALAVTAGLIRAATRRG